MTDPAEPPIVEFATVEELWAWLASRPAREVDPGVWVRLFRVSSARQSIRFEDLLEAGIAHGWSESGRRSFDAESYLQRFSPRRTTGTTSERNRRIAARLEAEGRMTDSGRRALGTAGPPR
jgi:uncharacterized protein YdeI (YjbR/CyaY-like superfamily)